MYGLTYDCNPYAVVGAVTLTLQPLWPESTRTGVWYASMGLFGVMGFLVLLIIGESVHTYVDRVLVLYVVCLSVWVV